MCSCDLIAPSVYRESIRTAKKQHKCSECGATIKPKDQYVYIFGVWDGDPRFYKQCMRCKTVGDHIRDLDDCGYGIGELYEYLREAGYLVFNKELEKRESTVDWLIVNPATGDVSLNKKGIE